uniref:Uncharacterized protein n=1 Tax=viral metagenome TaxID=1070528 RepID=A0A6C0HFE5_9ZZZZ
MLRHFSLLPFIAGLIVGAVIFFGFKPDSRERVVKWPNPENSGKVTYRDRNGLCYIFESQIVDCGKVKEKLQAYSFE